MFSRPAVLAMSAVVFAAVPLASASADDCADAWNATRASIRTPYTAEITTRKGDGKIRTGHFIMIDDKMYTKVQEIWSETPAPRARRLAELDASLKAAKVTCQRAADENIDGQSVTVYTIHSERGDNASDDKVWVSKALGLPVKTEDKTQGEDSTENTVTTSTMNYSDVHAPNGMK